MGDFNLIFKSIVFPESFFFFNQASKVFSIYNSVIVGLLASIHYKLQLTLWTFFCATPDIHIQLHFKN